MATVNALVSLVDVKLYLHIDTLDTIEDTFLDRLIDMSTGQIERYCRRKLKLRILTETYDGTGSPHLILREFPIISVAQVNIDPLQDFAPATDITLTNVVISAEEGRISVGVVGAGRGAHFPRGTKNVKVVYDAGFAAIPAEVELAALKLIAVHFHKSREGGDGIAAEGLGSHSITWIDGLPSDIIDLLREVRRSV